MAAVKHYNWLYTQPFINIETSFFFTELCVITTDISCRSLIEIDYKFEDGGQNGGRAKVWLYIKRLYFISSVIAFIFHFKCYSILHFAVCQLLCWALLFLNQEISRIMQSEFAKNNYDLIC